VRWTGSIQIRRRGRYHWQLGSDDGSKLYINDRLRVNNDGLHGMRKKDTHGNFAGKLYLKLDYFERTGGAGMIFKYHGLDSGNKWVYAGDKGSKVYPIAPKKITGFKEEHFYNRKNMRNTPRLRGGASYTRVVKEVVYGSTGRAWSGFGIVSDNFAVRWTGVIQVSKPGKYRFRLISDDGSMLYVGGGLTVNNDGLHGMTTRHGYRVLRNRVSLDLSFFERTGGAGMTFAYMGPDTGHRDVWVGGCCSKITTN